MTQSQVIAATDASFKSEVLESDIPVLVDFWAEWCGPCKAIAPIVDEIASEKAGSLKVCKVNVDENQQTPAEYGVRGIPTLVLFKNGEIVQSHTGSVNKSKLEAFVAQ